MPRISADLLDAYSSDVDLIRKKFDQRLRISMLNLFEHSSKTADTILVLPSGERIPIHSAIIRQRAPDFFFYLEHNFNACREGISEFILVEEPSNLISFLKLVYSDDEVPVFADFTNFESLNQMPTEGNNRPNDDSSAKKTLSQNSSDILKQSEPYCQTVFFDTFLSQLL
jgi:hypothetical protein